MLNRLAYILASTLLFLLAAHLAVVTVGAFAAGRPGAGVLGVGVLAVIGWLAREDVKPFLRWLGTGRHRDEDLLS
jgi:hypothetical protein